MHGAVHGCFTDVECRRRVRVSGSPRARVLVGCRRVPSVRPHPTATRQLWHGEPRLGGKRRPRVQGTRSRPVLRPAPAPAHLTCSRPAAGLCAEPGREANKLEAPGRSAASAAAATAAEARLGAREAPPHVPDARSPGYGKSRESGNCRATGEESDFTARVRRRRWDAAGRRGRRASRSCGGTAGCGRGNAGAFPWGCPGRADGVRCSLNKGHPRHPLPSRGGPVRSGPGGPCAGPCGRQTLLVQEGVWSFC